MTQKAAGIFEREGLDIDNLRIETRRVDGSLTLLDVFRARCDEQYVEKLRILVVRAYYFVVEAHLFHRKRDVLVRLDLDLPFKVSLREA